MFKTIKARIYPTALQRDAINATIGSARFVYNWGIDQKVEYYRAHGTQISGFALINKLPALKEEYPWLKDASNVALQQALMNLDVAFKAFFKRKCVKLPRYKSKRSRTQSYRENSRTIEIENGRIKIPKITGIKIKPSRPIEGKIKSVTVSKTSTDKYYVFILVDDGKELPTKQPLTQETAVGLDLGLKHFLIDSNGKKVENPKFLRKSEKRLKTKQRQLCKKQKGSKNRNKARKILATLHERVANQRQDFLHKLSTQIVHENQGGICIEDLNVSGMMKNHKVARSIGDAGWGEFRRQLTYKCAWYGKNLLTIGRFEPSSKTCSNCQVKNDSLELKTRKWTCEACLTTHDRDINAAVNIKNFAFNARDIGRNPPELTLVELNTGSTLKQEVG